MPWTSPQIVVVPFDFSDNSLAAIDAGVDLAPSAEHVYVIHVLPELPPTEPGVIWDTVDDERRKIHALEALDEKLSDPRYQGVQRRILFGDAGEQITEFAQRENANLIVLPSHGRRGISRLLIGSVAERVVRLAKCPVLVLKSS